MGKFVTVNYQTQAIDCKCCGQKLSKPKTSKDREFVFSEETCLEWLEKEDWETEAEYKEEFLRITEEFVYETISFFATGDERLLIEESQFQKVMKFISEEVIA